MQIIGMFVTRPVGGTPLSCPPRQHDTPTEDRQAYVPGQAWVDSEPDAWQMVLTDDSVLSAGVDEYTHRVLLSERMITRSHDQSADVPGQA